MSAATTYQATTRRWHEVARDFANLEYIDLTDGVMLVFPEKGTRPKVELSDDDAGNYGNFNEDFWESLRELVWQHKERMLAKLRKEAAALAKRKTP